MKITALKAGKDWQLIITAEDGRVGCFDVMPYLKDPKFIPLRARQQFIKFTNGGSFIKWACGANLPADLIEARWRVFEAKPVVI